MIEKIKNFSNEFFDEIVAIRRYIHKYPELFLMNIKHLHILSLYLINGIYHIRRILQIMV